MEDWLKEYNLADVKPFINALEKTREQYYPDEIDLLKDAGLDSRNINEFMSLE